MNQIRLAPVDTVTITTLVDNVIDVFMPGQDNVTRFTDGSSPEQRSASTLEGGEVAEHPRTEHGFSALVEVSTGDRKSVLLFDAGRTPDGLAHNIKVLGVDP
nr:MBL fold metallo-hydrolase [Nocardioidaceae bacterium]